MTVKQLKTVIEKLPDDMEVMMPIERNKIRNVCPDNIIIVGVWDGLKSNNALLLNPCNCMPDVHDLAKNLPLN